MCNFFSCLSDGQGNLKYLDWTIRKQILEGTLELHPDSHSSIASFFNLNEDKCNKWEYNPLTKEVTLDELSTTDDTDLVKDNLAMLDFAKIVPQLVIKPIVNPLLIERGKVTEKEIALLKKWASVVASVGSSVVASVGSSVWASVRASVVASVGDSVGDSVWASVRASVVASVWAYAGSFFSIHRAEWKYTEQIKCKGHPFAPVVKLWESGLVSSYDGNTWRLHAGKDAKIVYEWTPKS